MKDLSPLTEAIHTGVDSYMKSVAICVPGIVKDFDIKTQLASVQVAIKKKTKDGFVDHPILINVPVAFSGDTCVFGHSIKPDCEGMIHFSQRDADVWINQSGIVEPNTTRKFSFSDAFFTPNFRTIPNVIKNFKNDGAWISNKDCSQFYHLKEDGSGHIKLNGLVIDSETTINGETTVNGKTTINGDQALNGDLSHDGSQTVTKSVTVTQTVKAANMSAGGMSATGSMTAKSISASGDIKAPDIIASGVSLKDHVHSGVQSGSSVTGKAQ